VRHRFDAHDDAVALDAAELPHDLDPGDPEARRAGEPALDADEVGGVARHDEGPVDETRRLPSRGGADAHQSTRLLAHDRQIVVVRGEGVPVGSLHPADPFLLPQHAAKALLPEKRRASLRLHRPPEATLGVELDENLHEALPAQALCPHPPTRPEALDRLVRPRLEASEHLVGRVRARCGRTSRALLARRGARSRSEQDDQQRAPRPPSCTSHSPPPPAPAPPSCLSHPS
jgi:hypothetical protein